MMCKWGLGRPGFVLPIILLCTLAGCARSRTPRSTAPPISANKTNPMNRLPGAGNFPQIPRREVAILYHNAPGHAEIAAQLGKLLPLKAYQVSTVDVQAADSRRILSSLRGNSGQFVVAIGLRAARIARDELSAPIIFAQVFNYQELLVRGRAIRGVTAMPPLDLQVRDWKKIDPNLRRLGLIVSQQQTDLIPLAEQAAAVAGGSPLSMRFPDSDRATLYLFKRLAPQIDGLWLVPDDRILSPTVLRELLSYAVSHGVRVCVFSDAVLDWGALMSASPTPEDIARTVRRVLEAMMKNGGNAVPPLTPLSELVVRINLQVAGRFGLSFPLALDRGSSGARSEKSTRRSLITDILIIQFLITGAITIIALAGLTWTAGAVTENNLTYWAEQWAGELNELGAPFYLRDRDEAVLDVERFVAKYPEILQVTWYRPDGSVYTSIDKSGPLDTLPSPLPGVTTTELSAKAGLGGAHLLRENVESNRRFRLLGPIWVESFQNDGLFEVEPDRVKTNVKLLGFVAVDIDFSALSEPILEKTGDR